MASVICPGCGYAVDDESRACPHCGRPLHPPKRVAPNPHDIPVRGIVIAVGVVAAMILGAVVWGVVAGGSDDASASLACGNFYSALVDLESGVLTDAELRARLQDVYRDAKYSELPSVRDAASGMLSAMTGGSAADLADAINHMRSACSSAGS
jgi:hypothetical protein